jgi:hypothetical protein
MAVTALKTVSLESKVTLGVCASAKQASRTRLLRKSNGKPEQRKILMQNVEFDFKCNKKLAAKSLR